MMNKSVLLAVLALMSLSPAVMAADPAEKAMTETEKSYVFSCKNLWNQQVSVTVPAETQDKARWAIRNDSKYASDYNQCVFRTENTLNPVQKKQQKAQASTPPTE